MGNKIDRTLACIVIPVYKVNPTEMELKSFKKVVEVLGDFDIYLLCFSELNVNAYSDHSPKIKKAFFSKSFFESVKGYNRLCLSPSFYKRFESYTYMLIYQLDAYVFKNELMFWCHKGYDYIGAPWIDTSVSMPNAIYDFSSWFYNRVGNGGFSLRRIAFFRKWAYFLFPISYFFNKNEDFFWGVLLPKLGIKIAVPSAEEALHFAIESKPSEAFARIDGQLPFGCHAYEKNEKEFWKRFIV